MKYVFVLFLTWIPQIRYQWGTICFWGGYIRDYQWGASFVSDVDTEDATGEVHFFVSDLDTTDQKPWSVFLCVFCLFLTWTEQISYHGVFFCCCLGYNRSVPNEVHFLLFLTWIQHLLPVRYFFPSSDLDTIDLYQWRTYVVVSDLDRTDLYQ